MLEWIIWLGLTGTVATLLTGCSSTGAGATGYLGGRMSAPDRPVTGVEFLWTTDWSEVRGTITATLPTGERFKGNFVQVTHEVADTELVSMVGPLNGFTDAVAREGGTTPQDVWTNAVDLGTFRTEYANRIVAVLFGDRGNAMRCGFRLFDPPRGFRGNGTGTCKISYDNGTIAVQF
jgi:hypothetical protein